MAQKISIVYFGTYSKGEEYARNLALINGLKKVGALVNECHTELWPEHKDKMVAVNKGIIKNGIGLLKAYVKLLTRYFKIDEFDFMFVGYIGQIDVFLARFLKLFHKKPIIFDAFYSLYDTMVKDRGLYPANSIMAKILKLIDRFSAKCADLVLLDTKEHIRYFCEEFNLEEKKFLAVPLGVDEENFYPQAQAQDNSVFEVLNYSSYIPLHGLEVILQSAELLKEHRDIHWTLIGKGQLYPEIRRMAEEMALKNLSFIDWLPHKELVERARQADVLLGIFGKTEKASRVIPYKAYEALALARPLITGDSPAVRELLEDGKHCLLSKMGDARELAEKIIFLKDNPELRRAIASNGHQLFLEKCAWEAIGRTILNKLEQMVANN